ncbi:MAG: beta strand repeat-containing protein, partial [Thermoguttaceae bacterium]
MTWLSRLVPQSPSLRLAGRNNRTRQGQRRRRMATLETLEHRTLLSNVVALIAQDPTTGANTLTINGDTHNDSFSIAENADGTVTLVGTPTPSSNPHAPPQNTTQINSLPVGLPYTTSQAVLQMVVNLPGDYTNTDNVSMTGHGTVQNVTIVVPGVSPVVPGVFVPATNLTLNVSDLKNSGSFNVYDAPTSGSTSAEPPITGQPAYSPAGYTFPTDPSTGNPYNLLGGTLNASITGSQFSALTIEQDGCCLANVTLNQDVVPGSVMVYEGIANGDSVSAAGSAAVANIFGPTTINQYYGPTATADSQSGQILPCCGSGAGDTVNVNDSQVYSLAVTQNGPGGNQTIDIGTTSDVEVAVVGFGITATQNGNGSCDTIYLESITKYGKAGSLDLSKGQDSIVTWQGGGWNDSTTVDSSTVDGNISVTQGDGALDYVLIADDAAGLPGTDENGSLYVSQGNGYEDWVVVNSAGSETGPNYPGYPTANTFNNVLIAQGNSTIGLPVACTPPGGDTVSFDEATVNDNLFIFQNAIYTLSPDGSFVTSAVDDIGLGNNLVTIGLYAKVTVNGETYIYQGGAQNMVNLGGAGDLSGTDFETGFLDIYTGAGGGGFVSATNTTVDYGSYYGNNYLIDGGADGNTFVDVGENPWVVASDNFATTMQKATPALFLANSVDITYGTVLDDTQLDAKASVPGKFDYAAAGTVLTAGLGQTLSVTFTPTDSIDYTSATATVTINVLPATPTISWTNPANIIYGTSLSSTQLDATASVPGSFDYAAAGTVLTAGLGQTLSVTFTPTDSTDYTSATATVTINVLAATPTISWTNPANIGYGTALSGTQLDATASVPGTFTYMQAAGKVLDAGNNQRLSVSFTPADKTDYTSATATATINVTQATPKISWTNPANIGYGTALSGTQLDATASVPGTFTYTPAAGKVLGAGSRTLSVAFTPTDTTDYTSATATATINVLPATPTISWTNPANILYGTALSATQLDATANVAGTFTYTRAAGTVLRVGNNQTLSVAFTPNDTTDYTTATATATINVLPATPTISWTNPANIVYGTALSGTQLDATANVAG